MKKLLVSLSFALFTMLAIAQVSITVNVTTAGSFRTALATAGGNKSTITNLTVTGNIDARDVKFMRDSMPVLAVLNLATVQIAAYTGLEGTFSLSTTYPANEMPEFSFYNPITSQGKTSLTGISLPGSITSIGRDALYGCSGFTGSLTIPPSVTSIGEWAFKGCRGFTGSLTIPASVTSIGDWAFYGCIGFTGSLTIPPSVTSIGSGAFYGCSGFTGSLTIPASVTSIGVDAFNGCSGFTGSLTIPASVTSIGISAFDGCSGFTGSLTIPPSVTSIGGGAFNGCSGFTGSLTIPPSVTSIGSGAFYVCSGFTGSLTIPASVTSIGTHAFNGCSGFTGSLTIPASVTSIGGLAFSYCRGFTGSLTIPASVTSIGYSAFDGCSGFTGSLTIPASVTSIGGYAFDGCSGFTGSLTIPASVTSIGDYAFSGCWGFTGGLTIPPSVTSIGYSAFSGCRGFTGSLTIPASVASIGDDAFFGCRGFTGRLTIPASVTSIGDWAFYGCSGLSKIKVGKIIPLSIGSNTFNGVNKTTCELVVPMGSKTAYQAAMYWKDFINITEAIFVSFNSQGGSGIADTIVISGVKIPSPVAPTKTGYTFTGWYKEAACTNAWNFATDVVTTNTTLYAKWTINSYTVSFDAQGGSPVLDIPANYNTLVTAPTAPTKTGYTLTGWYKESAFTNAWNFAADVVTTNTTLYAKWNINSYTVSFDTQGGNSVLDIPANYNTLVTAPTAPTKTGYTLTGWFKEPAYTTAWNFATDMVTTNTTLYAKWNTNSYTVSFDVQGGSSVSNVPANYYTLVTTPAAPAKTGYTFAVWYKEAACTNAWNFATDVVTTNTTLYAKWTINSYTVSFDAQGGSSVSNIPANYNTLITAPTAPTKSGYTFAAWYKEAECTTAWNFATDVVTTNTTLYAKWDFNTGVEIVTTGISLHIFPNPAMDVIKIEGNNMQQITILNLLGNTVMQVNTHGTDKAEINVSHLKAGNYLVRVTSVNGMVDVLKLVKI